MAANLDRAETSLTAVSDVAYIRAIDSSGNSVRISKADLASVLGVRPTTRNITIEPNDIYDFSCQYGMFCVDDAADGTCVLVKTQYSQIFTIGSLNNELEITQTSGNIHIKNKLSKTVHIKIRYFYNW